MSGVVFDPPQRIFAINIIAIFVTWLRYLFPAFSSQCSSEDPHRKGVPPMVATTLPEFVAGRSGREENCAGATRGAGLRRRRMQRDALAGSPSYRGTQPRRLEPHEECDDAVQPLPWLRARERGLICVFSTLTSPAYSGLVRLTEPWINGESGAGPGRAGPETRPRTVTAGLTAGCH